MMSNPTDLPPAALSIEEVLAQSIEQVLQLALQQHQAGRLQEAEKLYRGILEVQPNHPQANQQLGQLLMQKQQAAEALPFLKVALMACPHLRHYWLNYIHALMAADQKHVARQMLALGQQNGLQGEAVDNLTRQLAMQSAHSAAADKASVDQADQPAEPKSSVKHNTRGPNAKQTHRVLTQLGQGHLAEVERLTRMLVARYPQHGFGWKLLGVSLVLQKHYQESISCLKTAANLMPDDAETYYNLGTAQMQDEQFEAADVSLRRAVALKPDYGLAYGNLGSVMSELQRHAQAELSLRRAIELMPGDAKSYVGLGLTLAAQGLVTQAVQACRQGLILDPNMPVAFSVMLFMLSHDITVTPPQLLEEHLAFGERFEAPLRGHWPVHSNRKDPNRCLHIGFVSGDLCNHAVANFLEPVLKLLAQKSGLSLHAYYTHTVQDEVTVRLHDYFAHWNMVSSLGAAQLADTILADGIDILIDLSGHTHNNRLMTFARKPAPIQITWIGYPGTTGLRAMDYILYDRFNLPPEMAWQFTEKLVYLPSTAVFEPHPQASPVNTLPALTNGFITFGSFNRLNKINDATIELWSKLLLAVPSAKMFLGGLTPQSQHDLSQRFKHNRIEPDRLIFYPRTVMNEYLALHHQVDVCLDAFPYGGGTTTCHAAWMGVPTLTVAGETAPTRSGTTIMRHLGLPQFIATSIDDFVNKGSFWPAHLAELAELRLTLRTRMETCALGQIDNFANSLNAAFRTMWQRWCAGLSAELLDVQMLDAATTSNMTPEFDS